MSKDGENAILLVRQMRILYEEISLLLQTADKYMSKEGWKSKSGNTAVTWSYHLAYPGYWIPQDIFRFYMKDGFEHLLPFIAVILFDRNDDNKITEPLLTGGWFDYGAGDDCSGWEYGHAHFHVDQDNFQTDGELRPMILKNPDKYKFKKAFSLALPLMDITDSQSLLDSTVKPILKRIWQDI